MLPPYRKGGGVVTHHREGLGGGKKEGMEKTYQHFALIIVV
jgi:hypothetical protein